MSPCVKSIHTSSANENSAPTASTPPMALIQLLKCERGAGAVGVEGVGSGMVGAGMANALRPARRRQRVVGRDRREHQALALNLRT